jgi:protein-S-isoprenylcysteine O-methyltransferase Ste14
MLVVRNVLATALIPGTVVGLIPYAIVSSTTTARGSAWGAAEYASLALLCLGVSVMLWCIRDFAVVGRGTLAPVDPPSVLVRKGLYRYVRNPMYLGALMTLAGEAAFFRSGSLLIYIAVWFTLVNVVVIFYEERTLARQFGPSYAEYRRSVGRWIPGKPE